MWYIWFYHSGELHLNRGNRLNTSAVIVDLSEMMRITGMLDMIEYDRKVWKLDLFWFQSFKPDNPTIVWNIHALEVFIKIVATVGRYFMLTCNHNVEDISVWSAQATDFILESFSQIIFII